MHCLLTIALNGYAIHILWVEVFHTFNITHITGLNDNIIIIKLKTELCKYTVNDHLGSSIIDLSVTPSSNLWNKNLFFEVTLRSQII